MRTLALLFGCILLIIVLVDAFETVILARRAQRIFRITRYFYLLSWKPYSAIARLIASGRRREYYLSIYGPLSLILLLGFWAVGLIAGFGAVQWALRIRLNGNPLDLPTAIYFSATSFFTLGLGEPNNDASKYLMVVEAGLGFSFLGLVIGYLPVLYQSFSNRERRISLLDARAGSPPSAAELILRQGASPDRLEQQLADWEEWAAELLEGQLSYSMLAYFRSQHANQSWLAALTTIVDASALVIAGAEHDLKHQAELTFAMGRHALVDLATLFSTEPKDRQFERLTSVNFAQLMVVLKASPTALDPSLISEPALKHLRQMYEPYAYALGQHFLIALPPWFPGEKKRDNWQTTSWDRFLPGFAVSDPFTFRGDE